MSYSPRAKKAPLPQPSGLTKVFGPGIIRLTFNLIFKDENKHFLIIPKAFPAFRILQFTSTSSEQSRLMALPRYVNLSMMGMNLWETNMIGSPYIHCGLGHNNFLCRKVSSQRRKILNSVFRFWKLKELTNKKLQFFLKIKSCITRKSSQNFKKELWCHMEICCHNNFFSIWAWFYKGFKQSVKMSCYYHYILSKVISILVFTYFTLQTIVFSNLLLDNWA